MLDQSDETPLAHFGSSSYLQESLSKPNNRRSTLLFRPQNQTEPPSENPNNSGDVNKQLKHEYQSIQSLNKALGSVIQDFDQASEELQHFSETLNRTDQLLSLWLNILERAEDTKSVFEDEHWFTAVIAK